MLPLFIVLGCVCVSHILYPALGFLPLGIQPTASSQVWPLYQPGFWGTERGVWANSSSCCLFAAWMKGQEQAEVGELLSHRCQHRSCEISQCKLHRHRNCISWGGREGRRAARPEYRWMTASSSTSIHHLRGTQVPHNGVSSAWGSDFS